MLVFQASPKAEKKLSLKLFTDGSKQPFEKALTESDSVCEQKSHWSNYKSQCKILIQTTEFKINYIGQVSGFKSYE